MGDDTKRNALLGVIAAVIAWWLWRQKAACHCDDATTPAAAPAGAPPVVNTTPPPPAAITAPPIPTATTTPVGPSMSERCTSSGGAPGWDYSANQFICVHPDAPSIPPPPPPVTPPPLGNDCRTLGGLWDCWDACAASGGTTLPDGSCCVPPACIPYVPPPAPTPAIPVPTTAPAPPPAVWSCELVGLITGPDGVCRSNSVMNGPPALPARDQRCIKTGGYLSTQFGYTDCICSPGTHQNGDGFCVSNVG